MGAKFKFGTMSSNPNTFFTKKANPQDATKQILKLSSIKNKSTHEGVIAIPYFYTLS